MKYAGLIQDDFVDGEGVCTSFWVQGCPLHCHGCHNPQTWDPEGGELLPDNYLDLIDKAITANGLLRNFSLLGGEPFAWYNRKLSCNILRHVRDKFPTIKIFCWTGYTLDQIKMVAPIDKETQQMLECIDILIDGAYLEEQRDVSLHLRGSRNQQIRYKGVDF